jgi:hypothetical protein
MASIEAIQMYHLLFSQIVQSETIQNKLSDTFVKTDKLLPGLAMDLLGC